MHDVTKERNLIMTAFPVFVNTYIWQYMNAVNLSRKNTLLGMIGITHVIGYPLFVDHQTTSI